MPYKNIVFIQLQKRLLNDPRWYMMSEKAQLLLIKIWLALASFDNRLTKDEVSLISILRTDLPINEIKSCIQEIRKNYPKFKSNKHFYYWAEFDSYTNYIPKGKSQGNPKEIPRKGDIYIHKHIDIDIKDPHEKQGAVNNSKEESIFNDKEKIILETVRLKTNIYALLEEFKNVHKVYPPKDLLMRVCQQFLDKGADIQEPYPYLKAALHRAAQDEESLNWKKEGMAQPLKEILGIK